MFNHSKKVAAIAWKVEDEDALKKILQDAANKEKFFEWGVVYNPAIPSLNVPGLVLHYTQRPYDDRQEKNVTQSIFFKHKTRGWVNLDKYTEDYIKKGELVTLTETDIVNFKAEIIRRGFKDSAFQMPSLTPANDASIKMPTPASDASKIGVGLYKTYKKQETKQNPDDHGSRPRHDNYDRLSGTSSAKKKLG